LLAGWLGLSACVEMQAQRPASAQPFVDKLVLNDTIQPVSADEVTRALDRANSDGAQALLIEMDTPGACWTLCAPWSGLFCARACRSSCSWLRRIARRFAGFFLLESADVAAMAPALKRARRT